MPPSSAASAHDDKTRQGAHDLYTLNAASQDSTLMAILQLLKNLLGGDSPLLQELGLVANAVTGLGNGGVSSYAQVTTAVRRHGIMGMSAGGTTGTIGGADIVSGAASTAIHKRVMETFLDPVTKQTTGQARGLSQEELGKAVALAIRGGAGSHGAIVAQDKTGNITVGGAGQKDNLANFEGEVAKTASLLKSIKSFLGSPALQNLDSTLSDLFGGAMPALGASGAQAQLQRMMTFSRVHSPEDPNKTVSFMVDGIAAGISQHFAGPGVGAEEAKARYGAAGTTSMVNLGIDATAGARGSHTAGRTEDPERYIGERSLEDIAEVRGNLTGDIMHQEQELMVGQYLGKLKGGDTLDEYKELEANLVAAGNDSEAVANARRALSTFVLKESGKTVDSHDLTAIARSAGIQKGMSTAAYKIMKTRSGDVARQTLEQDAVALGMDRPDATVVATGFANLTGPQQTELQELIKTGKIDGEGGAKEYIQKNLQGTLSDIGISTKDFTDRITSGRFAGDNAEKLAGAARHANLIPHFVSAGEIAAEQKTQLMQSYRDLEGATDGPDVINDLVSGALGQTTYTDSQVLRAMEGGELDEKVGGVVDTFQLDKEGKIDGNEANAEMLNRITGSKRFTAESIAADGGSAAKDALAERGKLSIESTGKDGLKELLFATNEEFEDSRKNMTTLGQQNYLNNLAELSGKDKVEWDPSTGGKDGKGKTQEDFDKIKKDMLKDFGSSGKINSALEQAQKDLGSDDPEVSRRGTDQMSLLKDVLGSDGMSEGAKDAFGHKLEEQIAGEETALKNIRDGKGDKDFYKEGTTDLNEKGQKAYDAKFVKKKSLEELYGTVSKGKEGLTQQVMRVITMYLTNPPIPPP